MCEGMPIIFKQEVKCVICGKSPAAEIDEYSDEMDYCRPCALDLLGEKIVLEMEE